MASQEEIMRRAGELGINLTPNGDGSYTFHDQFGEYQDGEQSVVSTLAGLHYNQHNDVNVWFQETQGNFTDDVLPEPEPSQPWWKFW